MAQTEYGQYSASVRESLDAAGFSVVRDIFSAEDLAQVRTIADSLLTRFDELVGLKARDIGAMPSGPHRQPEIDRPTRLAPALFRTETFRKARRFASTVLGHPARCSFNHLISKEAHSDHETPWHQDQAYLGPRIHLGSVNFWIPLQDVDAQNGCLAYVPGSHRKGLLPHQEYPTSDGHARLAEVHNQEVEVCPLRAGDFIIHTPLTLHRGLPNVSAQPRLAWAIHFNRYGRAAYFLPKNVPGLIERSITRLGRH